jgi:acyl-CoA thioesterase I
MTLKNLFVAGVAMILFGCTGCDAKPEKNAAPSDSTAPQGTIVAMGDSLTAGYGVPESQSYPSQLEKKLHQAGYHWRIVNAGISGETSSGALSRVNWVLKLKPDVVMLETGANDGLRGIDPQLVYRNIDKIVTELQAKQVVVVLAGMQMVRNMGSAYTDQFVKIYGKIAREHNLILVPFFLQNVAGEPSLNIGDGIHPNGNGYRIVTETVYPYVVKAIEEKRAKK